MCVFIADVLSTKALCENSTVELRNSLIIQPVVNMSKRHICCCFVGGFGKSLLQPTGTESAL